VKRNNTKLILGITGGFLLLCCGGTIATITGDDPATVPPAVTTPAAQVDATNTRGIAGATPAASPSKTVVATRPRTTTPTRARTSPAPKRTTAAPKRTTTRPKPARTTDEPDAVYYENCAAVRAAGAAPIRRGEPGYAKHLDRDGDGQGCGAD
jgi:hypothetical protein